MVFRIRTASFLVLAIALAASTMTSAAPVGQVKRDSGAEGATVGSPGVLSGNAVEAPIHVPVNLCGNTISVVGILNSATGNDCEHQKEENDDLVYNHHDDVDIHNHDHHHEDHHEHH
ncbi:hypothetical protein EDD11_001311 [Mortierella claussenii]|nr:hypothetical protein EDD11_001311 [Mortierella claussenii]